MRSVHFLYHELRLAESRYAYVTPLEEFEAHCQLFAAMKEQGDAAFAPAITFDDGHLSDVQLALPVLERHHLKAIFFITAGWTGRRQGFMTFADLRALLASGHLIGAHGMQHKLLTSCSDAALDEELRGARHHLEDGLGAEVSMVSLPGGRGDQRVLYACRQAGYRRVYTSVPEAVDMATTPFTTGRMNLRAGTTVAWLERVLDPESGALRKLQRSAQAKAMAQQVLGDRLYARLWAVINRHEQPTSGEIGEAAQ